MRNDQSTSPVDRLTLAVWVGTIGVGLCGWFASGTALAGSLLVVAVLLASASPAGALYATCAAIPLIFHPIQIGALQLGLLELGVLATSAGFGLRFTYESIVDRQIPNLDWLRPYTCWILPGLLLAIGTVSLLSMPFVAHRAVALRTWRWVIIEPILLFAMARWAITRRGPIPLSIAIVLPATIVSGAAIWQILDSTSSFTVDSVQRSTATYLHPNNLALYLERAFFLAFVPAMLIARRWRLPLLVISFAIAGGIAATFSRGAVLGLVAGGVVLMVAHPVRFGWRALIWGTLTAIGLFFVVAGQRFTGADSSGFIATRGYLWRDSVKMLRDVPITGIGLDQFLWLHQSRYIDPHIWSERYTSHPHDLLLDSWLSLGLAGAFLFAAMVGTGAWVTWQKRTGKQRANAWQLGALACLGAGLGHGVVDNGYFLADLAAMTWLAIALVITSAPESTSPPSHAYD